MMENTRENKLQYFAQSLGLYVWDNTEPFDLSIMNYVLSKIDVDGNVWVRHERDDADHLLDDEFPFENHSIVRYPISSMRIEHAEKFADILNFDRQKDGHCEGYYPQLMVHDNKIRIYIGKIVNYNTPAFDLYFDGQIHTRFHQDKTLPHTNRILQAYQYLHENDYAIPFNGLLIDKLIEYGWLTLRKHRIG